MNRMLPRIFAAVAALALPGSATAYDPLEGYQQVEPAAVMDSPAAIDSGYPAGQVERGRYLVTLLGCGNCHTDGALIGKADADYLLAGSRVGIATSNPMAQEYPGVVFPTNLTPDPETGLGGWSLQQIVNLLQTGVDQHGGQKMPVMPWLTYSKLLPEDAEAIAMYLSSLPPVVHEVPANVRPGQRTESPFIHFGVYRSKK